MARIMGLLVCVVVIIVVVVFCPSKTPVMMPARTAAINRAAMIDINTHSLLKTQPKRLKKLYERNRMVIWD